MSRIAAVLAATVLLAVPAASRAAFHITAIDEVASGMGGNPNVQYVDIRAQSFAGQNFVAHTRLTAFSCDGTAHTILLELPNNVTNGAATMHFLMATSAFAAAACIQPDFVIPTGILTPCGQICWGAPGSLFPPNPATWDASDPNNYVDCVAYGGYTGPRRTFDTAATALPPGDGLTLSLTRIATTATSLTDYALSTPAPTNNAGQTGMFGLPCPVTTTTTPSTSTTTTTSSTTTTLQPLGGDDAGCVPGSKQSLKCGDVAGKAFAKAAAAIVKCHKKQAHERFNSVSDAVSGGAEDTCSENNGGKSAKEKFDAAITKVASLCTPSQTAAIATAEATLFADKSNAQSLDALNGSIYCDGAVDLDPAGDDAGKVPVDKATLACEDTVGGELAKLFANAVKCHAKVADMTYAAKSYSEEACEEVDPLKHKAAHEKYSTAMDKLDAKGVCTKPCLARSNRDALATSILTYADTLTAATYPCN